MSDVEIVRVAERALLVRFPELELARAVEKAEALWSKAKAESRSGAASSKERFVLGAGSLLVSLARGSAEEELEDWRRRLEAFVGEEASGEAREMSRPSHRVEVRYGGEEGPDLLEVARERGLAAERVVELHAGAEYRVAFVGFSPGFPYLVGLPPELEVPRLAAPRPRVAAGSIAIAGPFAGIYPSATPGGWRLIGRLGLEERPLFDPANEPPARFAPGDRVRFVPLAP